MIERIEIPGGAGGFQEDKDLARELRTARLIPALAAGRSVVLDFSGVGYATQSFVHALIGDALQRFGADALDRIDFHHCSPQVRNVVELVVNYSLGGFRTPEHPVAPAPVR
jgi:hypothetical protein